MSVDVSLNKCKALTKALIWQLGTSLVWPALVLLRAHYCFQYKWPTWGACTVSNIVPAWKWTGHARQARNSIQNKVYYRIYDCLGQKCFSSYIGWNCTLSACWSPDPLSSPLPLWHAAKLSEGNDNHCRTENLTWSTWTNSLIWWETYSYIQCLLSIFRHNMMTENFCKHNFRIMIM